MKRSLPYLINNVSKQQRGVNTCPGLSSTDNSVPIMTGGSNKAKYGVLGYKGKLCVSINPREV